MLEFILFIIIMLGIMYLLTTIKNKINNSNFKSSESTKYNNIYYTQKNILTTSEMNFYNKLNALEDKYTIIPQVCLAAVIQKKVILDIKMNYIN